MSRRAHPGASTNSPALRVALCCTSETVTVEKKCLVMSSTA
jgi:hypothetical protein